MPGTTYLVEIDLETKGDLSIPKVTAGVAKLDTSVSKMGAKWESNAKALVGHLDNAVGKAVDVGIGFAKWGSLAAFGALTYGVVGLNGHLESTKIALGSIFQANGVASSLPGGMKLAADTIAKMRVDAQKLPGEFEDLQNIFTTIAIPGFQTGASVDKLRDISAKLMATGKIAQMPMDQVAREAAQLVEGRSGAHNVLGMKLMGLGGDKAKAFNQLNGQQRLAKLDTELDKYKDSIDEFGKSWDGVFSTTVDIGKQVGTIATAPLFGSVKGLLADITGWVTENRSAIDAWAQHAGYQIAGAFEWGVQKVKEWYPSIKAFAENAYGKLTSIWVEVQPYVEKFGTALQTALKDPGTIDKLITLAKLYGAIKVGGMLGSVLGGVGMGPKDGWAGAGFGLAKTAAGGVADVARGAFGMATAGGEMGPMLAGAEALGAGFATLTPLVLAAGLAFAAYEAYSATKSMQLEASAQGQLDSMRHDMEARYSLAESMSQESDALGDALQSTSERLYVFQNALALIDRRSQSVADYTNDATNRFYNLGVRGDGTAERNTKESAARANAAKHPGGGHGTNIQKVEIVVTGNQEPSRVARIVGDHLANMSRNPGRSRDVPNYSSQR